MRPLKRQLGCRTPKPASLNFRLIVSRDKKFKLARATTSGSKLRDCFRVCRDEEFEGAGDDFEFDGKTRERLAVDLSVDGFAVGGFAKSSVGFEEMNAFGVAQIAEPERGEITEIAEAALRG